MELNSGNSVKRQTGLMLEKTFCRSGQRVGEKPSGGSDRGWRSRPGLPGPVLQRRRAVQELRKARAQLKLNELLLKLDRYRVIVVDDLGYVKRDSAETGVLFELIAHRYERGSLVITSNHPFSMWGSIFVDETMAVAAADRLIHHGYMFELKGESYRKKTAKAVTSVT
ncbi:Transposase (plasmid) [Shigella dysenteriae WRSd3]|uniref:Transposase n=1 Tax=Shigella dysenteriae WRSd3 TaxID=1401327 RepID=A0A090N940_SHIDY|nr:Transposase [Shigella dysenteriae WRSd3]